MADLKDFTKKNPVFVGTDGMRIPIGNSSQRTASANLNATLRYNTDINGMEVYSPNGWTPLAAPPTISTVTPSVFTGESGTEFTIIGSNFSSDAQVYFVTSNGTQLLATTVTFVGSSQVRATTPRNIRIEEEPLDVKVVQQSGEVTKLDCIDAGTVPTWITDSGSIGSVFGSNTVNVYVSAVDPEGTSVTYEVVSGSLPVGTTLTSANGLIQGAVGAVLANTTYNFVLRAKDSVENNTNRTFSYTILNRPPVWNTITTSYTIPDSNLDTYSANIVFDAYDPDGGAITYNLSGSVPSGFAFNTTNGALQLISVTDAEVQTNVTSNFTITANDFGNAAESKNFNITVEPAIDRDFPNTILLLSAVESNTILKDASSNNLNLIAYGDARASNFSPYNTSRSVYFNGSSYMTIGSSADFAYGTGDFSMECRIFTANTSNQRLITHSEDSFNLDYNSTGIIQFFVAGVGALTTAAPYLLENSKWYHVVVTRVSGVLRILIDGKLAYYNASMTASKGTGGVGIGNINGGGIYTGYMRDVRIVKGGIPSAYVTNATTLGTQAFTLSSNPISLSDSLTGGIVSLLACNNVHNTDANTTPKSITFTGTPSVVSWSPFPETDANTGSIYLDGTGDYVGTGSLISLCPPTSTTPFNIECWVYPTASTLYAAIAGENYAYTLGFGSSVGTYDSTTTPWFGFYTGGWSGIRSSVAVPLNAWTHLSATFTGSTCIIRQNGIITATGGPTTWGISNQATTVRLGCRPDAANPFTGYIADARIVIGDSVYTGNISVPTISLSNTANTKLLTLQNRQPHNNHGFQDSSNNKWLITRSGNPSQGLFTPFSSDANNWSVLVPETPGEYIQYAANSNFNFGTGQYSVDAWVYIYGTSTSTGYGSKTIFSQGNNATNQLLWLYMDSTTRQLIFGGAGSSLSSYNNVMNRNEWTHVAITRDASNVERMIVNGKLVNSRINTTNWGTFVNDFVTRIGTAYDSNYPSAYGINAYANQLSGYISNLRINIGSIPTELQTTSNTANAVVFVPPTSVVQDANTKLLMCRNNRYKDSSIYNWTPATSTTSVAVLPFSPFSSNSVYSKTNNGGSLYFDGSSDYLTPNNGLPLGSGDFTIDFWMYSLKQASSGTNLYTFFSGEYNGGGQGWALSCTTYASVANYQGLTFAYGVWGSYTVGLTTGNYLKSKTWQHIAVTRTGSTWRIFVDGVSQTLSTQNQGGTFSATNNFNNSTIIKNIGQDFYGYIHGLRIVVGTSLYTSDFVPPTSPPTNVPGTTILLPGTDAAIIDYTGKNVIETVNDTKANNIVYKFAPGSMSFDGTGDYLFSYHPSLYDVPTTYTIEFWFRRNSVASTFAYLNLGYATNSNGGINIYGGTTITADDGITGGTGPSGGTIAANVWYHFALVANGSNTRMFIDGTLVSTYNGITKNTSGGSLKYLTVGIAAIDKSSSPFNGTIQDLRITRTARYTTNFTPRPRKLPRR